MRKPFIGVFVELFDQALASQKICWCFKIYALSVGCFLALLLLVNCNLGEILRIRLGLSNITFRPETATARRKDNIDLSWKDSYDIYRLIYNNNFNLCLV
jgi:hypothetical protein